MSNENLNDFYNQNRFNKKLRERIDAYEPELSDSLWDRIEHDLVKKDSRSKRAVWMVYVLAGLLLVSAAGIYYLADQNQKLAEAVKEKTAPSESLNSEAIPGNVYQMPETTVEVERNPESPTNNEAALPSESAIAAVTTESAPSSFETPEMLHPVETENSPAITEVTFPPVVFEESNFDIRADLVVSHAEETVPNSTSIENKVIAPFAYSAKTRFNNPIQENIINKGAIDPRIMAYIGVSSDLGSTRQKVSGPMAARFNHEHPYVFKSNGVELGLQLRNGFYFESGLRFSQTGTNLWYDFTPITAFDTIPLPNETDSLISGSRHTVNQQNWLEIPLQVGYRYPMNSHWTLNLQTGLTYSMINSFSGVEPTESFLALDKAGSSVSQPFKNYWSLNLGLGLGYQIGSHWMIDVQGNYRRGLTKMNASSLPNHPDRIAEILNARIGLKYLIR